MRRDSNYCGSLSGAAVARLLLIDDDEGFRAALSELLRDEGYDVETADRVTVAVTYLESMAFDAIVSDLMMPGNGHLVADYVRSHQPDTPLIVISSYESAAEILAATATGADSIVCLRKPVQFGEIQEALEHALHR